MADWASLPGDLVNRIADRLLATDDIDYYMDLRAVCRGWRSSTADPKDSPRDPRFRPRQWAMLDEVHQSDARLFVNTGTGRFVRKDLPLLRRYLVVAGAAGGMVVLAERTAPHAARVLNPFTGSVVSFEAQVPSPSERKAAAHVIGSSPTLVLLSDHSIYWAYPDSISFIEQNEEHMSNPHSPFRLGLEGGIYAAAREDVCLESLLIHEAYKILNLADKPFDEYFSTAIGQAVNRCFLVESAGEMLIVFNLRHRIEVFRIDTRRNLLELVKNLGSRALFVGDCRCLSVDADKFASVEANCIYYVVEQTWRFDFDVGVGVCVYSLKDETEERAGGAIDSLNTITLSVDPPFSEVQLLCCYTFEAGYSRFGWHQMFSPLVGLFDELADFFSESDDFSDI